MTAQGKCSFAHHFAIGTSDQRCQIAVGSHANTARRCSSGGGATAAAGLPVTGGAGGAV